MWIWMWMLGVCVCVCACFCVSVYLCVLCVCIFMCFCIFMCPCVSVYLCVPLHTCTCACVHKYAYEKVWVCMHVTRVPVRVRLFEYKHDSICKSACIYVFFLLRQRAHVCACVPTYTCVNIVFVWVIMCAWIHMLEYKCLCMHVLMDVYMLHSFENIHVHLQHLL